MAAGRRPFASGLLLVAGVVAFTVADLGDTDTDTSLESPLSNEPARVYLLVFNMSLSAARAGTTRRWLVDSWSPRGGGGSSTRPSRSEGSPFEVAVRDVPERASTSLGAAWLLVPAGLVGLALLVPATLVVVERIRTRRALRAYDRER